MNVYFYIMENTPVYFEYTSAAVPQNSEILPETMINGNNYNGNNYDFDKITTPNLEIYYIDFSKSKSITHNLSKASSHIFYVLEGYGITTIGDKKTVWGRGDVFIIPFTKEICIHKTDYKDHTILFYANDSPLLRFLKCIPEEPRFESVHYINSTMMKQIQKYNNENNAKNRNRNGVLLSNTQMVNEKLNTLTHTMWSLMNSIGPNTVQRPHRHNSIAVDLCISVNEKSVGKVYTLMGKSLDEYGNVKDPIKMIWKKGCTFTTPPGWWHSHHNDSDCVAWVFPVQDAGLHTYMRTLDIQFVK